MTITTTPPYVMNSQEIVTQGSSSKDSMSCFMFAEHSLDALAKFWCGSFLPVIGLFVKHRREIYFRLQSYKATVLAHLRHGRAQ